MSYELVIGGEKATPLASIRGWSDFKLWVDTLNADDYPQIVHLVEHSFCQKLDDLEEQLKESLRLAPPNKQSVVSTVKSLIATLTARDSDAESAFVTDGTSEDDGDDGEWQEDWDSGYEPA